MKGELEAGNVLLISIVKFLNKWKIGAIKF